VKTVKRATRCPLCFERLVAVTDEHLDDTIRRHQRRQHRQEGK
jgi:hypothetical protein